MGASGASTQLIFFVTALIVATAVVAVAANGVHKITNGIDEKSDSVEKELLTEISIINDPSVMPNDPVKIFVKNVGKTVLNQNYITVMLDGDVVADYTLTLSGNTSTHWDPASVLTITIDQALGSGDHTVMVTTENGVSDKLSFRI
jgi:archaellum component FlaG (FlaF/FlaG flagellin family)